MVLNTWLCRLSGITSVTSWACYTSPKSLMKTLDPNNLLHCVLHALTTAKSEYGRAYLYDVITHMQTGMFPETN